MVLSCAATILIGFTYPLSQHDTAVIKTATNTCKRQYPESPCLKKLIKKEELLYNAICGATID